LALQLLEKDDKYMKEEGMLEGELQKKNSFHDAGSGFLIQHNKRFWLLVEKI
jgi:hypothetical protein